MLHTKLKYQTDAESEFEFKCKESESQLFLENLSKALKVYWLDRQID